MNDFDLKAYVNDRRSLVDAALDRVLPPENVPPPTVHRAMRYSVMAGGKRLRPILVIAGAEAVGGKADTVMPTACALELVHTYSLIHDDLPAMDDDDYRRGRLTNHKVFGEAIAILAGDALLTYAFRLIAENASRVADPAVIREVILEVADAAGTGGMVGGQVVDIESEGKVVTAQTLEYIHLHKTAALIRASLRVGAMLAGGAQRDLAAIGEAGRSLGLAFQIVDDLEREAHAAAVLRQALDDVLAGADGDRSETKRRTQERGGLSLVDRPHRFERRGTALAREIRRLSADHALGTRRAAEFQHHLGDERAVRRRRRDHLERVRVERVAGEDRDRFAELLVARRSSAAEVVVVHRGQVVVDQAVRVHELDGARRAEDDGFLRAGRARAEQHERGTQPLAAAEDAVAHRGVDHGRLRVGARQELAEPRLDAGRPRRQVPLDRGVVHPG